jgi:rRNA maturation RNase YbeY
MEDSDQSSSVDIRGLPPGLRSLEGVLRQAAEETLLEHDVGAHSISISFIDDAQISQINKQRLDRSGPTDVIAFDLSEEGLPIGTVGDIYISVETAARNSERYGVSRGEELLRLVVHGVLHVLGYSDSGKAERERMNEVQEDLVKKLSSKLKS